MLTAFGQVLKDRQNYCVSFLCRSCGNPVSANVGSPHGQSPIDFVRQGSDDSIPGSQQFILFDFFPKAATHAAPDNCSERASKFFVEAKENLQRGNYETSVMLCRKVIDIATREILGEESNKEQLSQRISMLYGKGKITEQMKDWAHIVRIDSNGAVHSDEAFTKDEAEEVIGFTEVFLIYSFTLPEMVTAKQNASRE
ncbi:HEPN domain protein [Yersinia enterocolitica]|uniref:Hypothetical phage protein n=1 Tax=Yersinia enterocolitica serotype O:8 / biotype 1B (strain NCTC 13174 / 8081) TaxID=393305 RepID=A1JR47_YERE8|nr:HEPN domain protein [Yersinia enterocolitica]CAL12396.1 hypothetical phage protein [Yersinia enterocolitica subsp. enterocolitica 8081]